MADSTVYWAITDDEGRIETVIRRPDNLFDTAYWFWAEKRWESADGVAASDVLDGEVDKIITKEQADAAIAAGPRKVSV